MPHPLRADDRAEMRDREPAAEHAATPDRSRGIAIDPPGDTPVGARPVGRASEASGHPAGSGRRSNLVEIDLVALAAAGYITPEAQRSQIADEFRVSEASDHQECAGEPDPSRARQLRDGDERPSRTRARALSRSIWRLSIASEVDSTVLLVDADVANPNLDEAYASPPARGLLDLLDERSHRTSPTCCCGPTWTKLSLLPPGLTASTATEMLASTAMAELVRRNVHALPGSHPRLRFAASARHDRSACTGVAHGPDRHGRRSRPDHPRMPS